MKENYKKQYQNYQETNKPFDEFDRKSLQGIIIVKISPNKHLYLLFLLNVWMKPKIEFFLRK